MPFGIHLTLLIGPTLPVPAPASIMDVIESIDVTNTDNGRDGFQIQLGIGRNGPTDIIDYSLLNSPLLQPFSRLIIIITFGLIPKVLIDGIITHQQLTPTQEPRKSTLTITGEDVSVMMDLEEKTQSFPNMPDIVIVNKLILTYAQYGLIPNAIPPLSLDVPISVDWIPSYQGTDLSYIQQLASNNGYVFYIEPTDIPGVNNAYWGPLKYLSLPQKALSVNMGPETNVNTINFKYDALKPCIVSGSVDDRVLDKAIPVQTFASTRLPLSLKPSWLINRSHIRTKIIDTSGLNVIEAYAKGQAETDNSIYSVTVNGELDSLVYGDILRARKPVGLRGTGNSYDGIYYVSSVTHNIKLGEYKQSFTLSRDGLGSITPVVPP